MELSLDPLWNCTIGTCSDFFDLLNITGQESRVNESNNWLKQGIQQRFENHDCKHHMFSYASQGVLLQIHGSLCMLLLWRVLAYHGPYDFDPLLWLGCFSYRLRRWRDCFVCLTCHCNLAQQNLKNKKKKTGNPIDGAWGSICPLAETRSPGRHWSNKPICVCDLMIWILRHTGWIQLEGQQLKDCLMDDSFAKWVINSYHKLDTATAGKRCFKAGHHGHVFRKATPFTTSEEK